MYANLKGELSKRRIQQVEIANLLGLHENSVGNKINGKSHFTIEEAFAIKDNFFPDSDLSLKYLFLNSEQEKAG